MPRDVKHCLESEVTLSLAPRGQRILHVLWVLHRLEGAAPIKMNAVEMQSMIRKAFLISRQWPFAIWYLYPPHPF